MPRAPFLVPIPEPVQFLKNLLDDWSDGVLHGRSERLSGLIAFTNDAEQDDELRARAQQIGSHETHR